MVNLNNTLAICLEIPYMPMNNYGFVEQLNTVARNIQLIVESNEKLTPSVIDGITRYLSGMLDEVAADVGKGVTSIGLRKIDINLHRNLKSLVANKVYYTEIAITRADRTQVKIKFPKTNRTEDVYAAVISHMATKPLDLVNTVVSLEYDGTQPMLRFTDADARTLSNVREVALSVVEGNSLAKADTYKVIWYDTTSSLLYGPALMATITDAIIKIDEYMERIQIMYEEINIKYGDFLIKYADFIEKYNHMLVVYADILRIYNEILILVERAENAAERAEDAATKAENAILGAAKVFNITKDTTLESKHRGCWLNCIVPNDLDIINITIPEKDEKGGAWMEALEFIITSSGNGTVAVKAGTNVTLDVMDGCVPMIKRNGKVCSAKQIAVGKWLVYGALEDI